jgi:hypothetical protein
MFVRPRGQRSARAGTVVGGCSPAPEAAKLGTAVLSGGRARLVRSPIMPASSSATRHLLEREPPSCAFDLWQVDEPNLNTGIEKLRQEGDAARESRDVRDDERRAVCAAQR